MDPIVGSERDGGLRAPLGRNVRPPSAEAVEFSPALVPGKNVKSGLKTKSSGAGGVAPAVVADPPLPRRGDVFGGSGGPRVGLCDGG